MRPSCCILVAVIITRTFREREREKEKCRSFEGSSSSSVLATGGLGSPEIGTLPFNFSVAF